MAIDELVPAMRALGNARRLRILDWLKDPEAHFPPQTDGDLVRDGVCLINIAEKMKVSQSTLSEHMRILRQARLVVSKRVKKWTFYRRNDHEISKVKKMVAEDV